MNTDSITQTIRIGESRDSLRIFKPLVTEYPMESHHERPKKKITVMEIIGGPYLGFADSGIKPYQLITYDTYICERPSETIYYIQAQSNMKVIEEYKELVNELPADVRLRWEEKIKEFNK